METDFSEMWKWSWEREKGGKDWRWSRIQNSSLKRAVSCLSLIRADGAISGVDTAGTLQGNQSSSACFSVWLWVSGRTKWKLKKHLKLAGHPVYLSRYFLYKDGSVLGWEYACVSLCISVCVCVLVTYDCCNKFLPISSLKQQKFILPQLRRLRRWWN